MGGLFSHYKSTNAKLYSKDPANFSYGKDKIWDELSPLEKISSMSQNYADKGAVVAGEIGKHIQKVGAGFLDVAERTSPLEGVRNTVSGVQETIKGNEGMSALDSFEKGVAESQARKTHFENVTGKELTNTDGTINWDAGRDFIFSAMEAPTYAYSASMGTAKELASKGLLERIARRSVKSLPEAGINTALQAGQEGTTERMGTNLIINALLMSGISNIAGEIKLPAQLAKETISSVETETGKALTAIEKTDITDALKQGVKADDIIKNVKKVSEGTVTPDELANVLNETHIGITSFRGKPVKTVAETLPYYESTRAKGFLNSLNNEATNHNLVINEVNKSAGFWEGNIEPSFFVKVTGTMDDKLAYAAKHGIKANQDAVVLFTPNKTGVGTEYVFDGIKNTDDVLTFLKKYDIQGATVQNGKLILYDVDGSLANNINKFSKKLNYESTITKGDVKFLEKSEYENYSTRGNENSVSSKLQETTRTGAKTKSKEGVKIAISTKGKVAKAASDVNKKIVSQGMDELPREDLAKYTPITKEKTINDVAEVMGDWNAAKKMAITGEEIPSHVKKQVLFNAVKNKALKDGDYNLMRELANSPIASERSLAAQELGSAGFNNETDDVVTHYQDISKAREKAVLSRLKEPTLEKAQTKIIKEIKAKTPKIPKETWGSFIESIKCKE